MGNVANLIMGAGTLYLAPFGEAEPADLSTAPAGNWVDGGFTDGGASLLYTPTYQELSVDQLVDVPGRRLIKREFIVRTALAEPTLENLLEAWGQLGTITADAPNSESDLEPTIAVGPENDPGYRAVILEGFAPGHDGSGVPKVRRVFVRKALQVSQSEARYAKDGQTMVPVELHAHYVSGSIAPFAIIDAD